MDNSVMTPKQIVAELDRFIIGQHEEKCKLNKPFPPQLASLL